MIKRLFSVLGVAALLSGVGALASTSTVSAANMNSRDCDGNMTWGTPVLNSQKIGVVTVLEYTYAGYQCWWNGSGYTVRVNTRVEMNRAFAEYGCMSIWAYGFWTAGGCANANGVSEGNGWYYQDIAQEFSFSQPTGFGVNDRSGTSTTMYQPSGGVPQTSYVENWTDK